MPRSRVGLKADTTYGLAVGAGLVTLVTLLAGAPAFSPSLNAQTDLDAFMKDVVARRDDNWRKLQQYILDEREELALNGPGGSRLWGQQRDFTWFIRDGFFVRSPVRVDGAVVGEADRRKAEDEYLRRTRRRDARGRPAGPENAPPDSTGAGALARPDNNDNSGTGTADPPTDVDGLIRQTRQPQFVSSSYFLRFKFDEGRYALAGREKFEGRDVLKVEYYPTKLYEDGNRRRQGSDERSPRERQQEADIRRLMNKVALVTLWIEPLTHQIVKYTFDNVDFEFLPGAWLVKVDTVKASMTMSQPFPEVWLPRDIDLQVALTFAIGQLSFRQNVSYRDYREANVASKVIIPGSDGTPRKR
jgi:hypothetical protein